MTDPESREPCFLPKEEAPLYIYQIENPIGTIFCITAHTAVEAAEILADNGIEPFMIRRGGMFIEMGRDEE